MIWIIILSIVALIVVLGLSGYAIRLLKQLKQQNIMIAKSKAIRQARLRKVLKSLLEQCSLANVITQRV